MTLRQLMLKDTPCDAGLSFIAENGIQDWELADCWDLIKEKAPDFLGWGVKHAPMSPEKIKAVRLVIESGIVLPDGSIDQKKNHDPAMSQKCFGWMANPFRRGA